MTWETNKYFSGLVLRHTLDAFHPCGFTCEMLQKLQLFCDLNRECIWYCLGDSQFDGIGKHMSCTNTCMSDQYIDCGLQLHTGSSFVFSPMPGLTQMQTQLLPAAPTPSAAAKASSVMNGLTCKVDILWCHALTIRLFRVTASNPSVWFLHVLVHIGWYVWFVKKYLYLLPLVYFASVSVAEVSFKA